MAEDNRQTDPNTVSRLSSFCNGAGQYLQCIGTVCRNRKIFFAVLCSVLFVFAVFFWLWASMPPHENSAPERVAAVQHGNGKEVRLKVQAGSLPYEEDFGAPVEEGVKKVDYALIKALTELGIPSSAVHLESVEIRKIDGEEFHYQRLAVKIADVQSFVDAAGSALAIWAQDTALLKTSDSTLLVSVHDVPTHELILLSSEAPEVQGPPEGGAGSDLSQDSPFMAESPVQHEGDSEVSSGEGKEALAVPSESTDETKKQAVPVPPKGRVAIVIDDLGESLIAAKALAALNYPVTFSIWPQATNTEAVAKIAMKAGKEVMVHQPMEPMRYPSVKPGPGCVFVNMTRDQIRTIISENLKLVPGAVGINNHMGSAFTQDDKGVSAVVSELASHNLFVLDSYTHPKSVLYKISQRLGLRTYRRSVFIDVVHDVASIVFQLKKAERIALAHGQAIAIGHPMKETIKALQEWGKERNPEVAVVMVQALKSLGSK